MITIVVAATLAVTACSSGDDPASDKPVDGADGSAGPGSSSDGAADASGGDIGSSSGDGPPSLSDDFAIAIPDGWTVDVLGEIGMTSTSGAQLLYPDDAFDDIVAFYDEWTASQSAEYSRTEAGSDVIYSRMESPIHIITVTQGHQERDDVFTYLLVTGDVEVN